MAIQKTPPLGWPHTEAEEHRQPQSQLIVDKTRPPAPGKKGCGCGCARGLIFLLILIAIVGIAAAILIPELELDGDGAASDAERAFTQSDPGWSVESSDLPEGAGGPTRLVVWDDDLYLGRLVWMDQIESTGEWVARPLIRGVDSAWDEELLLEAFSEAFSDAYSQGAWVYVREAITVSQDATTQPWIITYRLQDTEDYSWSDLLEIGAVREVETGIWNVDSAASGGPASDGNKGLEATASAGATSSAE